MHLQMQNAFYFPFDHQEFPKARAQLFAFLRPEWQVTSVP